MQKIQVLLLLVLVYTNSYSQSGAGTGSGGTTNNVIDQLTNFNVLPSLPQVSGLGTYGNPALSGATGAPQIAIPIYTLQEDGVSIPIVLTYDATGIRAEDISTETGLKWHLQAGGSISRTIRGLADDDTNNGWRSLHNGTGQNSQHFPTVAWNSNPGCYQRQLEDIENNYWDVLPDMYSYNLPERQGSFFLDNSNQLHKSIDDDLKITYSASGWSCVDNMGTVYSFGGTNYYSTIEVQSSVVGGNATVNPARSGNGINEWHLNTVTTKNGENIQFSYTNYSFSYSIANGQVKSIAPPPQSTVTYQATTTNHSSTYSFNTKLLDKIESPHVRIEFVYATDNAASVWKKKLTEIKIISRATSESKSFVLEYDRYGGCPKLRLRKITERGINSSASNRIWAFNYNTGNLPDMNTPDADYFGYYNAAGNYSLRPVDYEYSQAIYSTINSRNVNNSAITNGILTEIVYPTGGKTNFYYEANRETVSGKNYAAPGVRLQKTEDWPDANSKCHVKEYFYSGLTGNVWEQGNYNNFYETCINQYGEHIERLYSSPKRLLNPPNGYGYKQIETRYYSNNVAIDKEITYYDIDCVGYTYYPKIARKLTYKGMNTLLQKTEYAYSTIGSYASYALGWRIESEDCIHYYFDYYCNNTANVTKHYYKGIYTDFRYDSDRAILVTGVTTTDYSSNDSIKNSVGYGYDSNLQLTFEYHASSGNSEGYVKQIQYPTSSLYSNLYAKHMTGVPIGINEYKETSQLVANPSYDQLLLNTLLIGKAKWEYDNNGNPTAWYDFINNPANDYLLLKESYTYGNQGKIRQITHKDGTSTVYLWGYNYQYPIAEIKNATFDQVKTILGQTLIDRVASATIPSTEDSTAIGNLRTNTNLSNVYVTTYSYQFLRGIQTVTNPRGLKNTYNYDTFGRLLNIKDENDKTVESYDYHYKN
ncbi:hypothetical protein FACS1894182_14500 [Bacteroidia bacterium]|nr:hypothetical protein FACS1894182_14500 [Bacteroidia bacterium]